MHTLQQAVLAKKAALAEVVAQPLDRLAEQCAAHWPDPNALDRAMQEAIGAISNCRTLYAWDRKNRVISSLIQPAEADTGWRGADLSQRPYLKNNLPFKGIMLSSVYQSMHTHEQCVTALHAVNRDGHLLGFIAADFALGDLLMDAQLSPQHLHWQQFRGDPAVRSTLFMQERVQSKMDDHIDQALQSIECLVAEHGIFHVKIHFSSGRCSFWLLKDPYNYRIHTPEEIVNPDLCLFYPMHAYPAAAQVRPAQIPRILDEFKALRYADETVYLRSGSLNIMNGMVGLTFSCDGSHYMPADEFLEKNLSFWIGELAAGQQ